MKKNRKKTTKSSAAADVLTGVVVDRRDVVAGSGKGAGPGAGRVGRVRAVASEGLAPALARFKAGAGRARSGLVAWVLVSDVTDDQATADAAARETKRRAERVRQAAREVTASTARDAREGVDESETTIQARQDLAAAKAIAAEDAAPAVDVDRHRLRQRAGRGLVVGGGAYGTAVAGATSPGLLALAIPAALVSLWVAGRDRPAAVPAAPVDGGDQADVEPGEGAGFRSDGIDHGGDVLPTIVLGGDEITRVLRDANVISASQVATPVGLTVATGDAVLATFDLPSGVPASKVIGASERIAGALVVDESQIDIRQAGPVGRASLWVSNRDPFETPRKSPLLRHEGRLDTWRDGIPLCHTKRDVVRVHLQDSMFLFGGVTRTGKGVSLSSMIAGAALDPLVNVRIVDGKGSAEHNVAAPIASTFFKGNSHRLNVLLETLRVESDRRMEWLDDQGADKLTPDLIEGIGGIELVIIDELAVYTAKGACLQRDDILEDLCQLSAVAAGAGMLLVLLTQVPVDDVIDGRLRANLTSRAAMRTESANQSNVILGNGMAGQGYDASKFRIDRRGMQWLTTPHTGTLLTRSLLIESAEKRQIIARGRELREAAGRLPGQWHDPVETALTRLTGDSSAAGGPNGNGRIRSGPSATTPEQRAVRDVLGVMDRIGEDRVRVETALTQLSGWTEYAGMSANQLGALLRKAGAGTTAPIGAIDGLANPNGYRRDALQRALGAPS